MYTNKANEQKNSRLKIQLHPGNYLSTPALRWDVMLSMTKLKLELISLREV